LVPVLTHPWGWHAVCTYEEKLAEGVIVMLFSDVLLPLVPLSLAYVLLFSLAHSSESEEESSAARDPHTRKQTATSHTVT
jgi:hypothetical protein